MRELRPEKLNKLKKIIQLGNDKTRIQNEFDFRIQIPSHSLCPFPRSTFRRNAS
jgi:hypothetical protein